MLSSFLSHIIFFLPRPSLTILSAYEMKTCSPPPPPPSCHGKEYVDVGRGCARILLCGLLRKTYSLSVCLSDTHASSILCRLPLDDRQIWEIKLPLNKNGWAWRLLPPMLPLCWHTKLPWPHEYTKQGSKTTVVGSELQLTYLLCEHP